MNNKNLANAQLLNDITSTDTVFDVKQGQGVDLPSAPFYATITPLGVLSTRDNSEIVQVTAVDIDELTVVRGQLDTVAKDFAADSVIANSIYVEDVNSKADRTTLIDALPASIGSNNQVLKVSGGVPTWGTDANTTYSEISEAEIDTGTASTGRTISGRRVSYIKSLIMGLVYPVGSLYFNATDGTNPASLLGVGTWEAYAQGRVPVGKASSGTFSTAGNTMGAETHTHGLSSGFAQAWVSGSSGRVFSRYVSASTSWSSNRATGQTTPYENPTNINEATGLGGSTDSSDTIQPSIVVYIWRRTS